MPITGGKWFFFDARKKKGKKTWTTSWALKQKKGGQPANSLAYIYILYIPPTPCLAQRAFFKEGGGGVYFEAARSRNFIPPPLLCTPRTPRRIFSVRGGGCIKFGPVIHCMELLSNKMYGTAITKIPDWTRLAVIWASDLLRVIPSFPNPLSARISTWLGPSQTCKSLSDPTMSWDISQEKEKAHEHKQFCPVTAVSGGVARPGGQGQMLCAVCGTPSNMNICVQIPGRRIGDRGDRDIVYVPIVYVPFLALN